MKKQEAGFTYIDTLIAITMLTVGILASLSALTYGVLFSYAAEVKTQAKEVTQSTMESVFAVRDLKDGAITSWDKVQVQNGSNNGIFLDGWTPIRAEPGNDGIYGTADDACAGTGGCTVNGITNSSPILDNLSRKIEITDIVEGTRVRKRKITVTVRYYVGQLVFDETAETIIGDFTP